MGLLLVSRAKQDFKNGGIYDNNSPGCCLIIGGLFYGCIVKEDCRNGEDMQRGWDEEALFCTLCNTEVRKYSKHCRGCDKCVDGFDHHCRVKSRHEKKKTEARGFIFFKFFYLIYILCMSVWSGSL